MVQFRKHCHVRFMIFTHDLEKNHKFLYLCVHIVIVVIQESKLTKSISMIISSASLLRLIKREEEMETLLSWHNAIFNQELILKLHCIQLSSSVGEQSISHKASRENLVQANHHRNEVVHSYLGNSKSDQHFIRSLKMILMRARSSVNFRPNSRLRKLTEL